jgi:asparagine synthetase B (glutamine-hydrolysing)
LYSSCHSADSSIAFYDQQKQNLLLTRDRFGKEPMYVHQIEYSLSFASEVRVLMRMHPYFNRVSTERDSNWLFWQTIPGGTLLRMTFPKFVLFPNTMEETKAERTI